MSDELYIGIDLGTTALKLGVFDAAGKPLARAESRYELHAAPGGVAEQNAEDWWTAFEAALARAAAQADLGSVAALCVVGHGPTVVPVSADGRPLRAAITWADRRATGQARRLGEKLGSGGVNVEFAVLPRIMWIRDHEPDVYRLTRWFFQPYDFLAFRLTGRPVTMDHLPGLSPWTESELESAGLDGSRFPEESAVPGAFVGTVRAAMAERLGLSPRTALVAGNIDAFSHLIGVNLSQKGGLCNVGGSSEGVMLAWDEVLEDPLRRVFPTPSPFGSGWTMGGSMSNSGGVLAWAVRTLWGDSAAREGVFAAAARVPAGSDGLIALPYLQGERTPIYDPDARGTFIGLDAHHEPAHMTRALLEGVAFGIRSIIEILEGLGGRAHELIVTGGTANAIEWTRIKADVVGKPVKLPEVKETGMLGAAILARAASADAPLETVAGEMVRFSELIEPRADAKAVYDQLHPLFVEAYDGLRETYRNLAQLRLGTEQ